MAYERLSEKRTIATNLNSFIRSQLTLIEQARTQRNLEDEAEFNRAVLEDNLDLQQQLDWRKDQLQRVQKNDRVERRRIRNEIATLRDLIEQKEFENAYYQEVNRLNSGMQSIETTLNWLENKLERTKDSNIKKSIRTNISNLKSRRYEQRKTALEAQTNYATTDKTPSIVEKQIERVNDERAKALKAGNEDYVALLDLQLQSLRKTATQATVNKTMLDFSVATMTGQTATGLLDQFNQQIEAAEADTPITVGGTRYESPRQFWEMKRADYLNDRSSNGFFPRYQNELKEKVKFKASKGVLTNNTLTEVKDSFDKLKDRDELSQYQNRAATTEQATLQNTADMRAQRILNQFSIDLDAKKAISKLAYIQDKYGVDQTLNYQKIVGSAAKEKEQQVNQILQTMGQLMQANPGMSNQEALKQAIESGAGVSFSPQEISEKKPSEVVTEAGERATKQQFGEKSRLDVPEESTFTQNQIEEGDLVKLPNSNTVYKMEGGQLRGFTGQWDEAQFKQYTGKGFQDVKEVKDISNLPQGPMIRTEDIQTPELKEGEFVKTPDSNTVYKVEDGKLRGLTGQWNEEQFKQYSGMGFKDVKPIQSVDKYEQGEFISTEDINKNR